MKTYKMNNLGFMVEIQQATKRKAEELANWLETGEVEEIDLQESAEMLRMQADEIIALRSQLNELSD